MRIMTRAANVGVATTAPVKSRIDPPGNARRSVMARRDRRAKKCVLSVLKIVRSPATAVLARAAFKAGKLQAQT